MSIGFFEHPGRLPDGWDQAFGFHPLKSRLFLNHLYTRNPIRQIYFWDDAGARPLAGCIYRSSLPFVLGPLSICRPASFCGVPMPFGIEAGYAPLDATAPASRAMDSAWPGFQIMLGHSARGTEIPGWTWKRHLPGVVMRLNFKDFWHYHDSLRHNYRKLVNRSLRKWEGVKVSVSSDSDFGQADYRQYLMVLGRQRYKTEALDKGFFSDIPVEHTYIRAYAGGGLIGWILLAPFGSELYTLFLGIDREKNETYDTYFNIFLETIRYALEKRYSTIHLGQTAEFAKMRLGGEAVERYLLVRHTNPAINAVVRNTDIFNYRKYNPDMHVMKIEI